MKSTIIKNIGRSLIIDPLIEVNERYLSQGERYRKTVMPICIVVAICLILINYFGGIQTFRQFTQIQRFGRNELLYYFSYWSLFRFGAYVIIPAIYLLLFSPFRLWDTGLTIKGWLAHWRLYLLFFIIVLPFVWLASHSPEFRKTYPFFRAAGDSMRLLVLWELIYGLQFFSLEFFFRGFILHTLKYSLGGMAVPVMMIPYCMIHFPKPLPECVGAIIAGLMLGVLSLKTNRIWGGVLLHVAVAVSMDVLALWQNHALIFS